MNNQEGDAQAPKRPTTPEELGFEPKGMVPWLDPRFLVRAGLGVWLSDLFARFADKREVEAGLPAEPAPKDGQPLLALLLGAGQAQGYTGDAYRDDDGALWIDYAADVGEGFDPTYTVAWLLAQPTLFLDWEGETHETRRGRLLILGGDQVYPSASWEAYRDRFVGPYGSALPFVPEDEAPHLYAIPGNHDWYDGLTSFMRLFCQGSWIGGWKTRQRRSYFALRLSDRWWLWATDIQFDTYIDGPQLDYFRRASEELGDGDSVILVTAKPSWLNADPGKKPRLMDEGSWETLSFVEESLIAATGARVAVTISGDKHHYARYMRQAPGNLRERIGSGGGGAHTSATHDLPDRIELRAHGSEVPVEYGREGVSPTLQESLRMRAAGLRRIGRVWSLGLLIGAIYALLAVLIADGIKDQDTGLESALANGSFFELLWDAATPWSIGLIVLLFLALRAFADARRSRSGGLSAGAKRWLFGALHTLAHVVPAVALTLVGLLLLDGWSGAAREGLLLGWIVAAGIFLVGFTVGRLVFAIYLWLANRNHPSQHATEIFGGLASTDYKNFLRLRLGTDGDLTIYPVGIRTSTRWELRNDGAPDTDPWFVPAEGESEPAPKLIEAPIRLP
jgi:hypothetical protein